MTENDVLLPCPFCGERPDSYLSGIESDGLMVECVNARCPVAPHTSYVPPEDAIAAWNTRPTASADVVEPPTAILDKAAKVISQTPVVPGHVQASSGDFYITGRSAYTLARAALSASPVQELVEALENLVEDGDELGKWMSAMDEADATLAKVRNQ